ncbi:hypothetical protein [Mesonia sp.]|uniref:hypothetical protein n=1 Tax=Mesonia sp. TaxID=1960830 RepID=UPI003F968AC7
MIFFITLIILYTFFQDLSRLAKFDFIQKLKHKRIGYFFLIVILAFTFYSIENSSFIARLKTPPQNSKKIRLGQSVNIKLANFPDNEFGILKGEVKNIVLVPDIDGLYNVDVSLPSKLITSYDIEIDFRQEMSSTAEIITEDLRLIERFFYPFKDVLTR